MKNAVLGPDVSIDVPRLIETRMLLQANSGGGKSYAIRKMCEATYGHAQQLIIDVDGEYHTLREKYDYVLAEHLGAHPNNKALVNNIGALRSRQLVTKGWPLAPGDVFLVH